MRAVVQRVVEASVSVDEILVSQIGKGLMVLVGVANDDTLSDVAYISSKLPHLRIFEDDSGRMNRSVLDEKREVLMVSQFTLYGDARDGRRPSYSLAASGDTALPLFDALCKRVEEAGVVVRKGSFGDHMRVSLINDGPVTILLDSRKLF